MDAYRQPVPDRGGALQRLRALRLLVLGGVLMVAAVGLGSRATITLASSSAAAAETQKAAIGEIYQLQAAFHRAKTTQDIDLMMSLWAPDGVLHVGHAEYRGTSALRSFWLSSGSFTHHRFSLVPSFKEVIEPKGDTAYLYFECHDVANFDQPSRAIVADTFLKGTVRFENGRWVFSDMAAGPSSPLSINTYY